MAFALVEIEGDEVLAVIEFDTEHAAMDEYTRRIDADIREGRDDDDIDDIPALVRDAARCPLYFAECGDYRLQVIKIMKLVTAAP